MSTVRTERSKPFKVLLAFVLLLACQALPAAGEVGEGYRLATGDKVRITVYGEDDLSLETRISAPLHQDRLAAAVEVARRDAAGVRRA